VACRLAIARLTARGQIIRRGGDYQLTSTGRRAATNLVRTHRLWETFLSRHLPIPTDHLHAPAERLEHITSAAMQQRLAAASDHPTHDPQGKPVPNSGPSPD
jgi:manganese/zinc/iron transport system permease protein